MGVRKDVATLGAGWSPDLEWYAKAINELQTRAPNVRTSWRYLGAIHGFDKRTWIGDGVISNGDPLPPKSEMDAMWNQCQHQGWWFVPWHRGYLFAFEAIIAKTITDLGGPAGWTLPYWNYFDTSNPNARDIPAAFLDAQMPDGSHNPLSAPPRSGVTVLGPTPFFPGDINLNCMNSHRFTSAPRAIGFGGGQTAFNQFGGQTGALEGNPHNPVHVMIGGDQGGFMADPDLAGLDPIFWLHHCNIDRLWAAWLTSSQNIQENGATWSNGPSPRRFRMPDPSGNLFVFTPKQTLPGGPLAPTYDNLSAGTGIPALVAGTEAAATEGARMPAQFSSEPPPPARLLGANTESVQVGTKRVSTTVQFDKQATEAAGDPSTQRVILNLENVRGAKPSGVLNIHVSLPAPAGTESAAAPEKVHPVALFGLAKASAAETAHGGSGISVAVDITDIARQLVGQNQRALEQLQVHLDQPGQGGDKPPITVERVSIYTQPRD